MDMEITVTDDNEINTAFVKSDFNCIEEEDVHQQEEDQQQDNDDNLDLDNSSRAVMWLKSETDFMLQRYRKYIDMVSSQVNCSIKTKKQMWQRIANEMKRELNVERTGEQIQNRYKTLMRRKRSSYDLGHKFPMRKSAHNVDKNEATNYETNPSTKAKTIGNLSNMYGKITGSVLLRETLLEINEIQEENRERRHREMMELWRECLLNRN